MDIEDFVEKRWLHSHEEDVAGQRVFRPDSYAFPLSRGRTAFRLHADGTAEIETPSPSDRGTRRTPATWTLRGEEIVILPEVAGAAALTVDLAEAASGKLLTVPTDRESF
jgi:hypothetical protein